MIEIEFLTKSYGNTPVIQNIGLSLKGGYVYCLLGKNGAGKTTLISLILDLILPDSGTIRIFGESNVGISKDIRRRIGVLYDDMALIQEITGMEYLRMVGEIYEIDANTLKKRIEDLLSYFFETEQDIDKPISSYSTGMKKKISFCASVIHVPEILILDEPFSGLDPLASDQLIQFLMKYKQHNRLIFISSHDLSYVEKVATHIGVLDGSQLIYNSTYSNFTSNGINRIDSALLTIIKPNQGSIDLIDWI